MVSSGVFWLRSEELGKFITYTLHYKLWDFAKDLAIYQTQRVKLK